MSAIDALIFDSLYNVEKRECVSGLCNLWLICLRCTPACVGSC
jgi:hypothetical protein